MKITFYQAPVVEVFDVITEGEILTSVESMNIVVGSWEEDD